VGRSAAPVFAGFGIGLALGGVPGPVQALLLAESARALLHGIRAMLGANLTFGLLLLGSAVGLSRVALSGTPTKLLGLAGGVMLVWLGAEGVRSSFQLKKDRDVKSGGVRPVVRGAGIVILNPAGWLFLATVAASLFATARLAGGSAWHWPQPWRCWPVLMVGDGCLVVFGGLGMRRVREPLQLWIRRALACLLALQGGWLIVMAATAA
jgi:threonine/homoserine/homoserine lactone efflux protein